MGRHQEGMIEHRSNLTRLTRRVALLGSTGSIGTQALDVLARFPDRFDVASLSAHQDWESLADQALTYSPQRVCLSDPQGDVSSLRSRLDGTSIEVLSGVSGMQSLAGDPSTNTVLLAVVGSAGLPLALTAVKAGKVLALANKESLVAAGAILMKCAAESSASVVPVDSEHSAILQSLRSGNVREVRRLILTASGGPFRTTPIVDLEDVTPDQALAHPTWSMGKRISIDSATMMNKALEIVEACELFSIGQDQVQVVIHPQSIVHSLVEFCDGSLVGQMGHPDMRIPIQFALTYPDRLESPAPSFDLTVSPELTFEEPDTERFPALELGYRAAREGGTLPAVMNAADEVAVDQFLQGKIPFPAIVNTVRQVMDAHKIKTNPEIEDVLSADLWAREEALRCR